MPLTSAQPRRRTRRATQLLVALALALALMLLGHVGTAATLSDWRDAAMAATVATLDTQTPPTASPPTASPPSGAPPSASPSPQDTSTALSLPQERRSRSEPPPPPPPPPPQPQPQPRTASPLAALPPERDCGRRAAAVSAPPWQPSPLGGNGRIFARPETLRPTRNPP